MKPFSPIVGIGLGPGDPDLMSVRARAALERADRLYHFAKRGVRGNARTIADAVVGQDPAREVAMVYPVTTELDPDGADYRNAMAAFYEECRRAILADVEAGRMVGVLCEGDPFFYGSFMHLWIRLKDAVPVETIPAITGMSAAWTNAQAPITWGDDVLVVLPGTLPADEIARRVAVADALVVMKLGRHLAKVRTALEDAGLAERAIYVERASMAGERIVPLAEVPQDYAAPYFSMILVPGQGRRP